MADPIPPVVNSTPVNPVDARAFLANVAPDPEGLKTMPDDAVLKYYERANGFVSKSVSDATAKVQPGKWPETWRQEMVGGDEKELAQAQRYASPSDIWKKARALEQRISSGELKVSRPFPEKGTPEEQNAWRTETGLPPSPDKYELKFPQGFVLGDDDKPVVGDFLKTAHAAHMPPAMVNAAANWFFADRERQAQQQSEHDATFRKTAEDALRTEWGGEYRSNLDRVTSLLDMAPAGIKDSFLGGRMADGTPIGSNPEMLKWMVGMARQLNPTATVVPGSGAAAMGAIEDEIKAIETKMRTDRKAYNADEKLQARYRDLLDAKARAKPKAA